MVTIVTEPGFEHSAWCQMILDNLIEQLRNKRIPFSMGEDTSASDGLFLIASDYGWIRSVVATLNRASINPIVICNQLERIPGCIYSSVCSDINAAMAQLLTAVAEEGRNRVAIYGVNPNSIGDLSRVDSLFLSKTKDIQMEVFLNEQSLEQCFREFSPKADQFDAVICANNYAAISLCRHLGTIPPHLRIYSCVKTQISEQYADQIYSLDTNAAQFGKVAVSVYELLKKNPALSCGSWYVQPLPISKPQATQIPPLPRITEGSFYQDRELQQILSADRLLTCADETDLLLLRGLSAGKSISDLAEDIFLSESTVKYRLKKMESICSVSSREELLHLAREFLKL